MDYSELKSGTDVRGTALDVNGGVVNLTLSAVKDIVAAFAVWLKKKNTNAKTVAVGGDSRLSTPAIRSAAAETLRGFGFDVLDCGLCSTPSMFMITQIGSRRADASIMVTASHHPSDKNGLKFFLPSGGLGGGEIAEILTLASRGDKPDFAEGTIEPFDFMETYCEHLRGKVIAAVGDDEPLKGLKIVVDAGNGAGAFYVDRILKPLGADTDGSQFLEPDGSFPNHIPNPENRVAMDFIAKATVQNGADLGVIFDTDVDRAAVVDGSGKEINRNALIALISAIILKDEKGGTIVTDSVTSDGLARFIAARGGVHHRFKRGYKNVIDEAVRLNGEGVNAPLAIETSGHAALRENYFLDDGAYLVTRVIIEYALLKRNGGELSELIADLDEAKEEKEIRLGFTTEAWRECGAAVIDGLKRVKADGYVPATDNHEGIRVSIPRFKGWFLVRMSVHDPIMPINIESDEEGGANKIAELLLSLLGECDGLDLTPLERAVKM